MYSKVVFTGERGSKGSISAAAGFHAHIFVCILSATLALHEASRGKSLCFHQELQKKLQVLAAGLYNKCVKRAWSHFRCRSQSNHH